jgi:hypothetical protein
VARPLASNRIARVGLALLFAVAGLLAAKEIVVIGLVEASARNGLGLIAHLRPQSARATAYAAESALAARQIPEATRLARLAVSQSPFDVVAVRMLGQAKNLQRPGSGDSLRVLAGRLGWRDRSTQLWLIERALRLGELEVAVQRAEALLRLEYDTRVTFGLYRLIGQDTQGRRLVIRSLERRPFWRGDFLNTDVDQLSVPELLGMVRLLDALRHSSAPPSVAEARPTIDALVAAGRTDIAFALYRRLAPPAPGDSLISNSGFDAEGDNSSGGMATAFDWRVFSQGGSTASVERLLDENGNRVLYALADGATNGRIAERRLMLPPGRYELAYRMRSASPDAPRSLQFGVRCSDRPSTLLPPAEMPLQPEQWQVRRQSFSVPADNCASQILQLESRSSGTDEIEAYFDDVRLRRLAASQR